jgi:hypothetical protein
MAVRNALDVDLDCLFSQCLPQENRNREGELDTERAS